MSDVQRDGRGEEGDAAPGIPEYTRAWDGGITLAVPRKTDVLALIGDEVRPRRYAAVVNITVQNNVVVLGGRGVPIAILSLYTLKQLSFLGSNFPLPPE